MSLQTINNGNSDNDPAAEKIRLAFEKAKEMFVEIYGKVPLELAGEQGKILVVKATEDGFELVALAGGGDMLSSNNLNDVLNPASARINLGLGTAATEDSTAFATVVQGAKADTALQSVGAGTGITIDITDPLNPIITNNETNDYVASGALDYANQRVRLTLNGGGTVDVSIPGIKPVIYGFTVDKAAGNVDFTDIEVGDKSAGWEGDRYIAFETTGLPYTTESNRAYAIKGEIL
jgi:hypothetical protein